MCVVSAVSDFYREQWQDLVTITREQYNEYLRLKQMARELDIKTKQPDCVKPDVEIWEKKIEEILRKKGLL